MSASLEGSATVTAFYGFLIANLMGGEKAFHLNLIFFFFLKL